MKKRIDTRGGALGESAKRRIEEKQQLRLEVQRSTLSVW